MFHEVLSSTPRTRATGLALRTGLTPRAGLALGIGLTLGLGALLATPPAQARNRVTAAFTVQLSPLFAGPGAEYPQLQRFTPQTQVDIMGCLPDFGWCDVAAGGFRGWMNTRQLTVIVNGYQRPVPAVGPAIGVPVTPFVLGPYWVQHYRNQPWFNDPRYAAAIESYRVQSRTGNTVIEYERTWQARPQYDPSWNPIRPSEGPVYVEPPVIYAPAPAYPPPQVYRPAPLYRDGAYYEAPVIYPDQRFDRYEDRRHYEAPRVNPLRPSPNYQEEPQRVNPLRPSPNHPDPQGGMYPPPPGNRALPENQVIMPGGRALK